MAEERGHGIEPECCSTPRHNYQDSSKNLVSLAGLVCSTDSDESEADTIERNIRLSISHDIDTKTIKYPFKQLTQAIETTSVLDEPIMHTAESPSRQISYPGQIISLSCEDTSNTCIIHKSSLNLHEDRSQDTIINPYQEPLEPSAPTLQEMQSKVPMNFINDSRYNGSKITGFHNSCKSNKQSAHLGKRPKPPCTNSKQIIENSLIETVAQSQSETNCNISQEHLNISLSPITSPNTSLLLQPPIHWYYSNPDGSWMPLSNLDSQRIELVYKSGE